MEIGGGCTVPSLAELQRRFARALRDPGLPAPLPLRSSSDGRRFDVYRNNVTVSLVDALRSTFPAVHRLVGEEYFAAAARAYISEHPPRSPVLLLYGETFGEFLDRFPSASGAPYLGDVARLEWARMNALHAADAAPTGIDGLSGLPEESLESAALVPHPSLGLVASRWPVVSLWQASVDPGGEVEVDMRKPEQALVVRPALMVEVRRLPPGGAVFVGALLSGCRLGEAVQQAADAAEQFDLAMLLQLIFEAGAVAAVNPI